MNPFLSKPYACYSQETQQSLDDIRDSLSEAEATNIGLRQQLKGLEAALKEKESEVFLPLNCFF